MNQLPAVARQLHLRGICAPFLSALSANWSAAQQASPVFLHPALNTPAHTFSSTAPQSSTISSPSTPAVTIPAPSSNPAPVPSSSPSRLMATPPRTPATSHTTPADTTPSTAGITSATEVVTPGAALPEAAPLLHHVPAAAAKFGPLYDNPWFPFQDKTLAEAWDVFKLWRKLDVPSYGYLSHNKKPSMDDLRQAFPINAPDYHALANPPVNAVQALWVGHASVLVQMEGATFITDPVFSNRCSFSQLFGPQRVAKTPFEIEDPKLPHLDFVLISHNHYDHLDLGSVKRLYKRYGDKLRWYVPLGLTPWFAKLGITNVAEADWWQEFKHPGTDLTLALTPAQHWSARGLWDRRRTLWGGWVVKGKSRSFWFAGDTGYCPVFKEIGERYGPFDLSAIPTGAYMPRELVQQQHVDPAEAVQIHLDVRSKRSIAIHCCTFFLTFEPLDEPPLKLRQEVSQLGLPADEFVTLQHGEILQTADGVDLNAPRLLGTTLATPQASPARGAVHPDGLLDGAGLSATVGYHTKADADAKIGKK